MNRRMPLPRPPHWWPKTTSNIATPLKFILEHEGFAVVLARGGREAQQLIDTLAPPGWWCWT